MFTLNSVILLSSNIINVKFEQIKIKSGLEVDQDMGYFLFR